MKTVVTLLFFAWNLAVCLGQGGDFKKGVIIDSLALKDAPNETYALYLPNSYKANQLSPIVFIFDPSGRARNGIGHFVKAAEKYGYVLVCSNNTKNGPHNVNFDYANNLFQHVFTNFNIDNQRIYTAGFSGGSRLAMAIAVLTKRMQGVIACGSGFPGNVAPVASESFSYAGIVGNRDMNYLEMNNNKALLNALQVSNELFVYDFGHAWPSQDQLVVAFDWLQLEAFKKGLVSLDESEIVAQYLTALNEQETETEDRDLIRKYAKYQRILKTFAPYLSLDSIVEKAKNLKASKEFVKQQRSYKAAIARESELSGELTQKFLKDVEKPASKTAIWQRTISKLSKKIEKTEDLFEKRMLQRVVRQISVTSYETAFSRQSTLSLEQLMFCYEVWIFTAPQNPYGYFIQMRNAMKKGDEDLALEYLSRLVDTGYSNLEALENFQDITPLQSKERYKAIIKRLQNNGVKKQL